MKISKSARFGEEKSKQRNKQKAQSGKRAWYTEGAGGMAGRRQSCKPQGKQFGFSRKVNMACLYFKRSSGCLVKNGLQGRKMEAGKRPAKML